MNDGQEAQGYSSADVCEATNLRRSTLNAWVLRCYFNFADGPGTGQTRRFAFDEVVQIAIAADLTKLGLTVATATHAASILDCSGDIGRQALTESGWMLVVARSLPTTFTLIKTDTLEDLHRYIRNKYADLTAIMLADISMIVHRTKVQLDGVSAPRKKGRPPKKQMFLAVEREDDPVCPVCVEGECTKAPGCFDCADGRVVQRN